MKKMKLLTPIMATIAASAPALVALSGCSKKNYTEQINELKDQTLSTFIDISKTTHRGVWNEMEIYDYIRKSMQTMGFNKPAGCDWWSKVPEVQQQIIQETKKTPEQRGFPVYGNIWYDIPATKGYENVPKIILHCHMDSDMAFKDTEAKTEWESSSTNAIDVIFDRDNDILKTSGKTSLGADNGLGIALMLAIAKQRNDFNHGGIRLLFCAGESEATTHYAAGSDFLNNDQNFEGKEIWQTVPQETSYLEPGSLKPFGEKAGEFRYIISTSGIYKNAVYISTAGIHECAFEDSGLDLSYDGGDDSWDKNTIQKTGKIVDPETGAEEYVDMHTYKLSIKGLLGGQSAKNINKGYCSAIFMLMRMLFSSDLNMQLISASSQPGAYAISDAAEAVFTSAWTYEHLEEKIETMKTAFKNSYPAEDWDNVSITFEKVSDAEAATYKYGLSGYQTRDFIRLCSNGLIYGPVDWFDKEQTNVKTSCNYGKLRFAVNQNDPTNSSFEFHAVCRSADHDSLLLYYALTHSLLNDALIGLYTHSTKEGTPQKKLYEHLNHVDNRVWERDPNNKISVLIAKGYQNMGVQPIYWDNHGWVEIGCYLTAYENAKFPQPQMTCVGPEIRNSKSINEQVWTDTLNTLIGSILYALDNVGNL